MKKPLVILIYPKTGDRKTIYVPLALLHLAAYLRSKYQVAIVDTRVNKDYKRILSELLNKEPLAVGITALTGKQISYGLEVSRYIKKINPKISLIWGGIHVTFLPKQALENPYIDIVVKKEGEISLYETLSAIQNGSELSKVQGIAYKNNGNIFENTDREFLDMNQLPIPAWDLIDTEVYIRNLSLSRTDRPINITTSRGCPYRCAFCYNLSFNKGRWRGKDASLVIEELKYLVRKYKVNRVIIHDDNFASNRDRALEIAERIKESDLKIIWSITLRICDFKEKFLRELVDAGLYNVRTGGESGSQRILDRLHKDISVEQIIDSANLSKKLGLETIYTFVIGWPEETKDDIRKTIDLIFKLLEINPLSFIHPLYIYTPYPGTDLFQEAKERGFSPPDKLEDWARFHWSRINIPWIREKNIFEAMRTLSKFAFYNRRLQNLRETPIKEGKVYPKIFIYRLGGLFIRRWARFRFKRNFWRFPYECTILKKIMEKI